MTISELIQLRGKAKRLHYELHEAMIKEFEQWKKDSGWEKRLNDVTAQIDSYSQQIEELEWEEIRSQKQALEDLGFESRTGHKIYDNDENESEYEDDLNEDSRWLIVHQSLPPIDYTNGYFLFNANEERFFGGNSDFFVVLGWGVTELEAWQQACKLNSNESSFLCPKHLDRLTAIIQSSQKIM